jgi:hypothetical protein
VQDLKTQIELILLKVGSTIKIHVIDKKNTAIEIDYDMATKELLELFDKYCRQLDK